MAGGVDSRGPGSSSRGLYKRALEIKEQSGVTAGISDEEKAEILSEIDALGARVRPDGDQLAFVSLRRGGLLPIATNIAAVVVIGLGLAALIWRFGREERLIVAQARSVVGAEGQLVAALRAESAARIAERDRSVEDALRRLRELTAERDLLRSAGVQGQAPDGERAAALERRIAEAAAALEQARLAQREAEAAAAPAVAAQPAAPPPQALADSERLAQGERLALERLAAHYRGFESDARDRAWDAAGRELDDAEAFLAADAVARLPVIQRIRPVEEATLSALRGLLSQARQGAAVREPSRSDELLARVAALVRQAEARFQAGQAAPAETLYQSALSEVAEVRTAFDRVMGIQRARWQEEQAALNRLLAELQSEVARGRQQLAAAAEELEREREARRVRTERVTALTRALREQGDALAGEGPSPAGGRVFDLLRIKALLMQVVDSAPVRAQYPELYDSTLEYLDRYGAEKAGAGEQAALARVVSLLDGLLGQRPADTAGMTLQDTFRAVVDRLAALLRAI